jgi:hypothetical protein
MMKLKREARTLKIKSLSSMRRALTCFNSFDEDGRVTSILLHLQHASEMLLKALLIQTKVDIRNPKTGNTEGVERCIGLAKAHCGLTDDEAGVIRTIDSLRDAAQHWIVFVDEGLLFLYARALVTVIDDVLKRNFEDDLASHLPVRILPISTDPLGNIDLLIDREYRQIARLLEPGRRARDEARGRIRTLLAMEGHTVEGIQISERDIDRIERAIRAQKGVAEIFPRLQSLATTTSGEGIQIKVHFSKKQGPPVRFVSGDDPEAAAAVREVDLQAKFRMQATELSKVVGLTPPKCGALRAHLGIDDDPQCVHVFAFGKQKISCFSDNAVRKINEALPGVDMDAVWQAHRRKQARR